MPLTSHALIYLCRKEVMILIRKMPYGIQDNYFKVCNRDLLPLEKLNTYDYICGKIPFYEDFFDFPKGRGRSVDDAMREFMEETGLDALAVNADELCTNIACVDYIGLDLRQYRIIFHLLISQYRPKKVHEGECQTFLPKWMPLAELVGFLQDVSQLDERGKYEKYITILKKILTNNEYKSLMGS